MKNSDQYSSKHISYWDRILVMLKTQKKLISKMYKELNKLTGKRLESYRYYKQAVYKIRSSKG